MPPNIFMLPAHYCLLSLLLLLSACGGSSGGQSNIAPSRLSSSSSSNASDAVSMSSSSSATVQSSSSSSLANDAVTLRGRVTYDYVPFTSTNIGLDYAAVESRPVRGAVVAILSDTGDLVTETTTDSDGAYSVEIASNLLVRVRVKAQLKRTQVPMWDFRVTDNTQNNGLYVLDGTLASSGTGDSRRNLHASSGWNGDGYGTLRAAAPFAILDSAYLGLQRVVATEQVSSFPLLEFRWSVNNNTATNPDGDLATGEIGTSSYTRGAIYILGQEDSDTDEYDSYVILHELGHYFEAALSRVDSVGGAHGHEDYLDMRVALSEGFGNAFAAMIMNDPLYRDSSGIRQERGFYFDIAANTFPAKGWFSEGSIEAILYHYYHSAVNKTADDLTPIFEVLTDKTYKNNDALTSIFLFADRLIAIFPQHENLFRDLLAEQNINSMDRYALGETNNADFPELLPVYTLLAIDDVPVNVCSTSRFGKYNKLGVSQFLKLNIPEAGDYQFNVNQNGGEAEITNPDFIIYHQGKGIGGAFSDLNNSETKTINLAAGNYVMEVYDRANVDIESDVETNSCFNVQVTF